MSADLATYLSKVTPKHRDKPKFMEWLAVLLEPLVALEQAQLGMAALFDIDDAVGDQLDTVGRFVGVSRNVPQSIAGQGLTTLEATRSYQNGQLQGGTYNPVTYATSLDDTVYRKLLKAKRLANTSDGSTPAILAILTTFLDDPAYIIWLQPSGDHSPASARFPDATTTVPLLDGKTGRYIQPGFLVCIAGKQPSIVELQVINQNLLPIGPAGARVEIAVVTAPSGPVFGVGRSNTAIGGFGAGSLGSSPERILNKLTGA